MSGVATEAIVQCRRVIKRIYVKVPRAWSDVEIAAVGRQVGLSLVGPDSIEALAQNVVANSLPEPAGSFGICGVNVQPARS